MAQFSKYTSLKLLVSYLLLLSLMAVAIWVLFKQQANLNKQISVENTDKRQLIYTELIRDLYESDNYARVAIQTVDEASKRIFLAKNASVIAKIDFLKSKDLVAEETLLDTLKYYLKDKEQNILNLRKLQQNPEESPIGDVLRKIKNLEDVKGKLTLESFIQNPNELSSYERKVAEDYINYLNKNVPKDASNTISVKEVDSLLTASKQILEEAQKKTNQRSIVIKNKEIELLQNELRITQKLSDVILLLRNAAEKEEEKIEYIKSENQKETLDLIQKSAIACVVVVLFFFFLLSFDFFKNKTYRQQLEIEKQKTEQLLESREQLMTTVSHDIKTPLQSLLGYSEQLLASEVQVENRNSLIKMKSATNYIEQLVSGLLDYVRMEKGKVSLLETVFEVNELIEETAQNIADLNQEKPIVLNYEINATEGYLYYGDYNKLRQILYNLIGNAFKFTKEGSVSIQTAIHEEQLTIRIIDTGIGISKSAIANIFKPFTQASSQIETLYGGTGLGLSICNRLIQLLDGKIFLESEQNKGSQFTIALPLKTVPESEFSKKMDLDSCLLLDDDENQLALTKALLTPYFKTIFVYTNGIDALKFLDKHKISLLITDIQMPEMNGFEFLKEVRSRDFLNDVPVIAISGTVLSEQDFLTNHRFNRFITKPYSAAQLLGVISEFSKQDLKVLHEDDEKLPSFIISFIGNDKPKILAFLKSYESDLENDICSLNEAVQNSDLVAIGAIVHKMQTMISQFQEQDLLQLLKTLEVKVKSVKSIQEIRFELHNLNLLLSEFQGKINRLIQID
ncbi:hybrid sensor histidine kinase/response regulator [Flavobacterium cucumis]|uniref:histidine kinase n=1 Tax=Flavobacterium cucumis TaxID=416016 RepID=A0A1M7ZUK8_9FLAO|nr:hybrid sensor histidine kinase/response regulator [Flavobacterium cucumis]SHO72552.1 Signal transduction histidine kinase [Flavobacterium cucumis]